MGPFLTEFLMYFAAGQERFGIVTSSYYRGAHGIILGEKYATVCYFEMAKSNIISSIEAPK